MTSRTRTIVTIMCTIMILGIGGCGTERGGGTTTETGTEVTTQKEQKQDWGNESVSFRSITKEYLMEHFELSEKDLEGVDIESFLSTYEIDVNQIEKYDIPGLLQFFVEEDAAQGKMSYAYMLHEPADASWNEDCMSQIVRIGWQKNEGDFSEALVFDFEKGKIYEGARMDRFDKDNLVAATDEETKQKVIQTVCDYAVYNWKDYYKGESTEGTTANYNWQLAIECSDGTLYRTGGDGLGDEAHPKNLDEFIVALKQSK